jgi:hypothetical protein
LKLTLHLFDKETIGRMHWPETEEASYALRYLLPFLQQPTAAFIPNVTTSLYVLQLNSTVLPVTVNEAEYDNSYVCSPYTHYVSYAKQELYLLKSRTAQRTLKGLLAFIGLFLQASRCNRTVHVNNWLLSTNLYPELSSNELDEMLSCLLHRFPQHALVFRSLNKTINGLLIERLEALGFIMVPSRQVYLLYPCHNGGDALNAKGRWLLKRDYGLLEKHGYEVIDSLQLTTADASRFAELYQMLYLDKYSYYNPQFGQPYFELALRESLLHFQALRHKATGRLDAVLGYYGRNGVMTTPIFGMIPHCRKALGYTACFRLYSSALPARTDTFCTRVQERHSSNVIAGPMRISNIALCTVGISLHTSGSDGLGNGCS